MKSLLLGLLTLALAVPGLRAGELGDPAAPLHVKDWVKGKSVDLAALKGKQVAVVEFWATWCPPCRASIPHLTELQKKFKDVVFVGVSDEDTDVVKKFVAKMGDKMDYVVAVDDDKQTSKGYMEAYEIDGIPHAFVVDKEGRVIWQGHPMAGLEEALDQIQAGKYDLDAEKAKARKAAEGEGNQKLAQKKLQQLARLISEGKDNEATKQLETELVAMGKDAGQLLGAETFDPADFRKRVVFSEKLQKYQRAVKDAAGADELAKLESALQTDAPKGFELAKYKEMVAAQIEGQKSQEVLEGYFEAVGESGDATKAAELGKKLEALQLKSPALLNQLAWTILTGEQVKNRDLNLALNLAKRGVEVTASKDAQLLDTYARALFDTGKTAEAIAQQKLAIAAADKEELKQDLGETLKKYQEAADKKNP